MLGGGAFIFDGGWAEDVSILFSMPTEQTGWTVGAQEIVPKANGWRLTVYAVCAYVAP